METLNLGFKKIKLTKQAKLVAFVYMFGLVAMLLASLKKTGSLDLTPLLVFLVVGSGSVYATNCVMVGNCNNYAWFLVFVAALSVAMTAQKDVKTLFN